MSRQSLQEDSSRWEQNLKSSRRIIYKSFLSVLTARSDERYEWKINNTINYAINCVINFK